MNRALLVLPGLLVALATPVFAQDTKGHAAAEPVQLAQVFTSEEWIGALITPVKPDPQRGLSVVPGVQVRVQFAFGSADLTAASKSTLDELGKALESDQLAPFQFRINGHTDAVGEKPFNQTLSESRASAVQDYLTANFAIDPARLNSVGLGEEVLFNEDDPAADENRRVEIMNVGPAG